VTVLEACSAAVSSVASTAHRLAFRADGGLDLSQLFLVVLVVNDVALVWADAARVDVDVPLAAWGFLSLVTLVAFVVWAARDRAILLAESGALGAIAGRVAKGAPES
jgi:hypothetical protein